MEISEAEPVEEEEAITLRRGVGAAVSGGALTAPAPERDCDFTAMPPPPLI